LFIPGSCATSDLDAAMRQSLADSLKYIHSIAGAGLGIPQARIDQAAADILAHRVRPGVFGRYYQLVFAVEQEQHDKARIAFDQLVKLAGRPAELSILPFTQRQLGEEFALYDELIDQSNSPVPWVTPLQEQHGANLLANALQALGIIESIDPKLADEIRGLVVEIVGASPYAGAGARGSGSGSSMMLWGLVIYNAHRYAAARDVVDMLVHEAAHLLLFAHTIDGPLVTNPIDRFYPSPLRADERPMDGVLHATFVNARRYHVKKLLRNSPDVDTVQSAVLDRELTDLKRLFHDGLGVIRKHGELTSMGRQVVDEMSDYMDAA
jgi:hypothetical protein